MINPIKKLTVKNRKEIPTNQHRLLLKLYENTNLSDNEKEYLFILMEMTTDEKCQWNLIKARHHVTPADKDGNRTMMLNGEQIKVKPPKNNAVASTSPEGDLSLDVEKLCKISKPKHQDAILQHEYGHRKLHTLDIEKNVVDKKRLDDNLRKLIADDIFELLRKGTDKDYKRDKEAKKHDDKLKEKIENYLKKDLTDDDKDIQEKDLINKRKEFREKLKKYTVSRTHANLAEFEADQYAANKVGKVSMIHVLNKMNKLDKEFTKVDIKNAIKDLEKSSDYNSLSDKEKKERKQQLKKDIEESNDISHEL